MSDGTPNSPIVNENSSTKREDSATGMDSPRGPAGVQFAHRLNGTLRYSNVARLFLTLQGISTQSDVTRGYEMVEVLTCYTPSRPTSTATTMKARKVPSDGRNGTGANQDLANSRFGGKPSTARPIQAVQLSNLARQPKARWSRKRAYLDVRETGVRYVDREERTRSSATPGREMVEIRTWYISSCPTSTATTTNTDVYRSKHERFQPVEMLWSENGTRGLDRRTRKARGDLEDNGEDAGLDSPNRVGTPEIAQSQGQKPAKARKRVHHRWRRGSGSLCKRPQEDLKGDGKVAGLDTPNGVGTHEVAQSEPQKPAKARKRVHHRWRRGCGGLCKRPEEGLKGDGKVAGLDTPNGVGTHDVAQSER
ncbi:hypothetical protein EXIGLDRAFT_704037 [Exidia glandulosa HHB12029]|uniref:Uncharacterized protein n=1 Tax=Exidia glandulosa HHB12029 TaxID=1314781 RepID=A0A165BVF7_EXIGL|nr:hypothetical protein EXIGLDRAFT_704037 [Exidia glandulosa HHB12029]